MLFNSYIFIFCFLPVFLCAWQFAASTGTGQVARLALVAIAFSLLFYGLWGIPFLVLFLALIGMNHALGKAISSGEAPPSGTLTENNGRKRLFIIAIILNLLPLLWFKYSWFFIRNMALILNADWRFTPPELPIGISFYTFIQIAWLTGIYRRQFTPDSIERHILFSSFFPYVISGPIVRYEQMGWQFDRLKGITGQGLAKGLTLFAIGLAKKVLLADSIGFYANTIFNSAEKGWPLTCAEAWTGSLAYTFQLYFDFSGYTDMALGIGLMLGLKLPENFNSPYKSTGIVDFWRRWHITLSSWLRDFLYIPLGGNRHGKIQQYRNLFLTMLIGGAWHGAGWTYIVWGSLHGLMLGINHFFRAQTRGTRLEKWLTRWFCRLPFILFTFFCLNFCWVVFRAMSLDGACAIYKSMFGFTPADASVSGAWALAGFFPNNYIPGWQPLILLGVCASLCWFFPNSREIMNGSAEAAKHWLVWRPTRRWATAIAILTFFALALISRQSTFLYFQF